MPPALLAVTNIQLPVEPIVIYVGIVVIVLMGAIPVVESFTRIISFFRAKPPLHKVYATKEELLESEHRLTRLMEGNGKDLQQMEERVTASRSEMEERLSGEIKEARDDQKGFESTVQKELRTIVQQLGELSGLIKRRST